MEEDDKLFLIAWDYSSTAGYVLQMIDPADGNKVTTIGNATFMSADDDIVYFVNSLTIWEILRLLLTLSVLIISKQRN